MFDAILRNEALYKIYCSECFENGVGIRYDESLIDSDGDINTDKVLILCIDEYYHSRNIHNPPASIDCLVILKCEDGNYSLHLIELRNVSSMKGVKRKDIVKKFEITIDKFLEEEYSHIFMDEQYKINDFKLYLITDACKIKKNFPTLTEDEYKRKIKESHLDIYLSLPPFKFRGKFAALTPCVPDYVISAC